MGRLAVAVKTTVLVEVAEADSLRGEVPPINNIALEPRKVAVDLIGNFYNIVDLICAFGYGMISVLMI